MDGSEEFLECLSDVVSDLLLFAAQNQGPLVAESYYNIEVSVNSLIAVGEEVREKVQQEELKPKVENCLVDIRESLHNLQRVSLELKSDPKTFTDQTREYLLQTGKSLLLASVRMLKLADMYDCLRIVKRLKTAIESTSVLGDQVSTKSEFYEVAAIAIADHVDACKGLKQRTKMIQLIEQLQKLEKNIESIQKLSEPFVQVVQRDVTEPTSSTKPLRERTTRHMIDVLRASIEIVELSSVDLFADIEASFALMTAGVAEMTFDPVAEEVSYDVEELCEAIQKMAIISNSGDPQSMIAELKRVNATLKKIEPRAVQIGLQPEQVKVMSKMTPLVQSVKIALQEPQHMPDVNQRVAELQEASAELFDSLQPKLSKARVDAITPLVKPVPFASELQQADLKQISDSNALLEEAANSLASKATAVQVNPVMKKAEPTQVVLSKSGMVESSQPELVDGLLRAAEHLKPSDCREVLFGDQLLRKMLNEGSSPEALQSSVEQQLLVCNSLQSRCKNSDHMKSLLELSGMLHGALNDMKDGMGSESAFGKYNKVDVVGILKNISDDQSLTPIQKELEWFKMILEGQGKLDPQVVQIAERVDGLGKNLEILTNTTNPAEMIQNGKQVATLTTELSKMAKAAAIQANTPQNRKELEMVADHLRNLGTQIKILSCLCASGGGEGNDPVKNCGKGLQLLVIQLLNKIQIARI